MLYSVKVQLNTDSKKKKNELGKTNTLCDCRFEIEQYCNQKNETFDFFVNFQ